MEKIGFEQVKTLLDGTRVFVRCTGSEWNLNELESWNIKHDDGLYYEDEAEGISFPYDFDYHAGNMDIECFVGDTGWRYFIVLLTDSCYGNFVESAEDSNGELPVCSDVSVAKSFLFSGCTSIMGK